MAEYVNVAVDAMGGDNAPTEIVKGAVEAVNADKRVKVFLVGKEPVIREELKAYTYDAEQLEVVHAEEVIEMQNLRLWRSAVRRILPLSKPCIW